MKWPTVLRAHQARTFQRTFAFEKAMCADPKRHDNDAGAGAVIEIASRRVDENPFIASARDDGENDLASRHIRNSISLTMRGTRRMICASHQRGA
jgi:hypothetical protein